MRISFFQLTLFVWLLGSAAFAQDEPVDKRAYGVFPNYRTANYSDDYKPLPVRRKFYIASKDSFDYPVFGTGFFFAGLAHLNNTHPNFGQGAEGLGKRYITSFADQSIGNFLTEGLMPSVFHEDPRYFRRGAGYGSVAKRAGYAATRIFVARNDKGKWGVNFAELTGNAAGAVIANAYYRDERSASDNVQRFATQLATDALSQVLKEFWPDIKKKLSKKH